MFDTALHKLPLKHERESLLNHIAKRNHLRIPQINLLKGHRDRLYPGMKALVVLQRNV